MTVEKEIFWFQPKFKDAMEFHWCEIGSIWCETDSVKKEVSLNERFKMFCRKSDCKCFIEDMFTNVLIEFNGARAQGKRICIEIIKRKC